MLTAPRTLITPTYCQTDIQRQGKACSVGIRVRILSLFNPWRTASPELEQSWYWTAREKKRNEKKMLFARPANSMLLQHSAWGHAASAAPSALERCQRGRSSWESNTSRIQSSHGCSRLWVHVNSLPRSYFLFTGTYFVKLFFFFSCVLYPAVLMTSLPMGSGILHLSSASLTPWIREGQHPGQQHGEVPLTMEALGTKNKTQNEISVRKEQNCSKLLVTSVTRGRSAMFLPVFSSKIPIDFNTVGYVPVHWNKLSVYGCRQGELASSKAMFNLSVLRSSSKGVSPFNPYLSEVTPKEMEHSACHSFVFLSLTSYHASHFVYTFPFDTWHAKVTNFIWGHNANVFMLSEHRLGEMNKE